MKILSIVFLIFLLVILTSLVACNNQLGSTSAFSQMLALEAKVDNLEAKVSDLERQISGNVYGPYTQYKGGSLEQRVSRLEQKLGIWP